MVVVANSASDVNSAGAPVNTRPNDRQLSMWTVVGSVSAAVIAAGILGGVGGVLQIPALVTDVAALRIDRDLTARNMATLSERVRSLELTADGEQRQINDAVRSRDAILSRLDERDKRDRELDIQVQRDLQSIEGRSKDRNTEVMGFIRANEAAQSAVVDRQRAQAEALAQVRRDLFELATRAARPAAQLGQGQQSPTENHSFYPPLDNDRQRAMPQGLSGRTAPAQLDATSTGGDKWQLGHSTMKSVTQ